MIMKKNLNEELKDIKYLFNYDRGRVISEQNMFDDDQEEFDTSMDDDALSKTPAGFKKLPLALR